MRADPATARRVRLVITLSVTAAVIIMLGVVLVIVGAVPRLAMGHPAGQMTSLGLAVGATGVVFGLAVLMWFGLTRRSSAARDNAAGRPGQPRMSRPANTYPSGGLLADPGAPAHPGPIPRGPERPGERRAPYPGGGGQPPPGPPPGYARPPAPGAGPVRGHPAYPGMPRPGTPPAAPPPSGVRPRPTQGPTPPPILPPMPSAPPPVPPDGNDAAYWYDLSGDGDGNEQQPAPVAEETRGPFEPLVSSADPAVPDSTAHEGTAHEDTVPEGPHIR